MTFEEGMKQSIDELVEKKTALEKRCFELETENSKLEDINLKLCEQNNELVEENGTLKTQVSILQGKNKGLKELVKGYENTRDRMIAMGFPTFKSVKEYSAKLKELEKEIVGLKTRLNAINLLTPELEKRSKAKSQHLTNAKEIIREFVEWATWQGSNCPSFKSIQNNAEKFLKELEG